MHDSSIEKQETKENSIDPTMLPRHQRSTFWNKRIEQWQQSGLTQKDFCLQQNLVAHQFTYWLNKFQLTQREPKSSAGGFVPVNIISSSSSQLHITLPNGIVLTGITEHNLGVVQQFIQSL